MDSVRTLTGVALLFLSADIYAQQNPDLDFDVSVKVPAHTLRHPRVVIDEAHFNLHTASGRYRPLAELLSNDGYEVSAGLAKFDKSTLEKADVLIIANARGADKGSEVSNSAFTEVECRNVQEWVRTGGALLLIADHAPFGSAAWELARRFGIDMGKGHVFDLANSVTDPTILVFSQDNELLADNAVTRGRGQAEQVRRVVTFEGQSLSVPENAIPLMKLGATAYEIDSDKDLDAAIEASRQGLELENATPSARSVAGRAQGVALMFGKGRVVVIGEAAMFSAQIHRQAGEADFKFGMNAPDNDDRQFVLNVLHWLSGLLR